MSAPNLSEVERPVIGRFYMVRCIRLEAHKHGAADRAGWVPIHGPEHHDRETIGFRAMHFHVDVRFLSDQQINNVTPIWHENRAARTLGCPVSTHSDGKGGYEPIPHRIDLRRKQCKRAMPDFPRPVSAWMGALEAEHADCKLKPGLVCPHRGIALAPFVKDDGTVICPGHGLRWNAKTGALIREVAA